LTVNGDGVNCKRCGSELTENGQFCPQCGYSAAITTAAPTQVKSKLDDESRRRKNQQKVKVYLGAIFVVFILAVFFIARSSDTNKTDNGDAVDTSSDRDASAPSVATLTTNFPALHFTSSGRLPIKIGSFQLGITVADALSIDSNLENCNKDKKPPSTSDPNVALCPSSYSVSDGFYNTLTFSRGRLELIGSDLAKVSPEDAAQFDRNTLNQLGKPDVVVNDGPSIEHWVWIDGDVRIQYVNNHYWSESEGAHSITMQLVIYPEFLTPLDKPNYDGIRKDDFLKLVKRGWGDDMGQVIVKPLPTGLPNLQLRMTPWQVRAALPGIVINTNAEHQAHGELDTANVVTSVTFWDGMLSGFTVIRYDIPATQFPKLRNDLIEELGTPSGGWPGTDVETIYWENNDIRIDYMLAAKVGNDGRPQVTEGFSDKRLGTLQEAAMSTQPPKYNPVPAGHSFF
jgi:hypothetical protein